MTVMYAAAMPGAREFAWPEASPPRPVLSADTPRFAWRGPSHNTSWTLSRNPCDRPPIVIRLPEDFVPEPRELLHEEDFGVRELLRVDAEPWYPCLRNFQEHRKIREYLLAVLAEGWEWLAQRAKGEA